jgi:hypothetical protein
MRFKLIWQYHDTNPKNVAVISPCFRRQLDVTDPTSGVDAQALTDDLANVIDLYTSRATPFTVKAYNIEGPPPHYPMATTVKRAATTPIEPAYPPELAVVLSFNDGSNVPRHRGRLYIPLWVLDNTGGEAGVKVSTAMRTQAGGFVSRFAALGGANVDWGVWSTVDHAFHKAANYYVSDAWGTIRSRGIKETARTAGTTTG